jgi:hypothetical protein
MDLNNALPVTLAHGNAMCRQILKYNVELIHFNNFSII